MKNLYKLFGVIALVAVIGFTMTACPNDDGGGPQKVTYVSVDSNGNRYTLEINESGGRSARSAAQPGDDYTLTVEYSTVVGGGNLNMKFEKSGKVGSAQPGEASVLITITINGETVTITLVGDKMTVINGKIVDDDGQEIADNPGNVMPVVIGGSNPFVGTWVGDGIMIECTDSTWKTTIPGYGIMEGTYIRNGNTATFVQTGGDIFGTASVSGDTMTVNEKANGDVYTLRKQSGSTGNGGNMTWTAVADSTFGSGYSAPTINAIAYGNNRFVAVGQNGKMAYSTNGITWTAAADSTIWDYTSGTSTTIYKSSINAIAYGGGKFVAGDARGKMAYSADGVSWTAVADSTFGTSNNAIYSIAYGGGRFVAVGQKVAYSNDGVTWTAVSGSGLGTAQAIAYGNGRFVAAFGIVDMAYSTDGVSWTAASINGFNIYSIAYGSDGYGGSRFVAGASSGDMAYSSTGRDWTDVEDNTFGIFDTIRAIAYGNGGFVAGGSGKMAYSMDGVNWTAVADSTFVSSSIYAIAYGGGKFVAGGSFGTMAYSSDSAIPGGITPDVGGDGIFTLNDIPAQYNGKYVYLEAGNDNVTLLGVQSINMTTETVTLTPISGGSVSIPMYINTISDTYIRYSGNHTVRVYVLIFNTDVDLFEEDDDPIAEVYLSSVTFSNGSATVSANGARLYTEDGPSSGIIIGYVPTAPTITTASLPGGTVGTAYGSRTLAATGDATIRWSIDTGELPDGLNLSSYSYLSQCTISGTPTKSGTYNFTVKATNSAGSDTKAFSIVIAPRPGPTTWTTISTGTIWQYTLGGSTSSSAINAIAYGNGRFVAGDVRGKMAYSADGVSWTAVTNSTFGGSAIRAITYGGDKFVAGGDSGKMAYSEDGISWTAVSDSTFGTSIINAIAYGIADGASVGRFVAGGGSGKMAYSDDNGVTWTAVEDSTFSTSGNDSIYSIAYGNGRFVAGSLGSKMAYSTDGVTWTAASTSSGLSSTRAIAYGGDRFVVGRGYSTNGASWTTVTNSAFGTDILDGIAYGTEDDAGGRFVAVGGTTSTSKMAYSTDGSSWTSISDTKFGTSIIYGIAYGNGRFVAVGDRGKMAYSNW